MRSARLVTKADFAVPGGPRTTRCCRASNATREARMTSSRSISDTANSRSMACSLSRDGLMDARLGVVDIYEAGDGQSSDPWMGHQPSDMRVLLRQRFQLPLDSLNKRR